MGTNPMIAKGVLVIGVVLLAGVARAAGPCDADIAKLCPDVPTGGGRIQACLAEHEKELSPACAARHASLEKEMGDAAASCRYDISRLCWDVAPGRGRVLRCLEQHRSDLSPVCHDRLQKTAHPPGK